MMKYWDSVSDMVRDTRETTIGSWDNDPEWTGYQTHKGIGDLLLTGDTAMVSKCDKLLSTLDELELPLRAQGEVRRDVFGSRVSIGEYTVGSPTCLRRRVKVQSDVAPLKILVGITSSAALSAKQIEKRGTLILALLRKIELVRPVELFVYCELDGSVDGTGCYFPVVRIDSKPLALAHAAVALCHVATARHLLYGWGIKHASYRGGWAKGFYERQYAKSTYNAMRRDALQCSVDDLIFDSLTSWDTNMDNPEQWLRTQLDTLGILAKD